MVGVDFFLLVFLVVLAPSLVFNPRGVTISISTFVVVVFFFFWFALRAIFRLGLFLARILVGLFLLRLLLGFRLGLQFLRRIY